MVQPKPTFLCAMPFACAGVGDTSAFPSLMRVFNDIDEGWEGSSVSSISSCFESMHCCSNASIRVLSSKMNSSLSCCACWRLGQSVFDNQEWFSID